MSDHVSIDCCYIKLVGMLFGVKQTIGNRLGVLPLVVLAFRSHRIL